MSGQVDEIRIAESGEPRVTVKRYGVFTRINHWLLALSFIMLAVSGAALFHPSLFGLTALFGGGQMTRWLHPVIGCVLMVAWIVMFIRYFRFNLPEKSDAAWLASPVAVMRGHEEHLPEIGRYNAGQKVVFWAFAMMVTGLFVSGILMWDQYFFDWTTIDQKRIAVLAHALLAIGMVTVWIVHFYAAVWVRGTLQAMSTGYVTGGWAFKHHRRWLRDAAAGRNRSPAP